MNKLGDILLSDLEVLALRRLLAQHITNEDAKEKAAEEAAEEERYERWHTALVRIARETARQDGVTTFWRSTQASASWSAFAANESYHSTFDVDEYFQPVAIWQETWEIHYQSELETMRREQAARA